MKGAWQIVPGWAVALALDPGAGSTLSRMATSVRCCEPTPSHRAWHVSLSICHGPSCRQVYGGAGLLDAAEVLAETGVDDGRYIHVEKCGCLGECSPRGANVGIRVEGGVPRVHKNVTGVASVIGILSNCCAGLELNSIVLSGLQEKEAANFEFARGNVPKAVTMYTTALALLQAAQGSAASKRVRSAILSNRSAAYGSIGSWDLALQDADTAVDEFPGLASAWKRKAEAHEALGHRDKALAAVQTALKLELSKDRREALEHWKSKLEAPSRWRIF
jgi:hypothetical protein